MKTTVTLNRYYAEDLSEGAFERVCGAIEIYNKFKLDMYNAYYNKEYCPEKYEALLGGKTLSGWMKTHSGLNDYYINALDSAARGCLTSQKELKKLSLESMDASIQAIEEKIAQTADRLRKACAIKRSLAAYAKTGKFPAPYSRCGIKVKGNEAALPFGVKKDIAVYEREIEEEIRRLKQRQASLLDADRRKRCRKEKAALQPPKRSIFGSRAFYKTKDTIGCSDQWKEEFHSRRNHEMTLPGRHTAATGNFLVLFNREDMSLTLIPPFCSRRDKEKLVVFPGIKLYRYKKEFLETVYEKSVCYRFETRKDGNGRKYILISITFELPEKTRINYGFADGCIGADFNAGFIAWADIDSSGSLLGSGTIPFTSSGSTDQNRQALGDACAKLTAVCRSKRKPLCIENLDLSRAKDGVHYGNRKKNRIVSSLAYRQFRQTVCSRAYRMEFEVYVTDPSYTSFMGQLKAMGRHGISIHESAAYMIALKTMSPEKFLELPLWARYSLVDDPSVTDLPTAVRILYRALKTFRTHSFYDTSFFKKYESSPEPLRKIVTALKEHEKERQKVQLGRSRLRQERKQAAG